MSWISFVVGLLLCASACHAKPPPRAQTRPKNPNAEAVQLIDTHVKQVQPLELALNLAWWKANTSGSNADFSAKEAAQNALDAALNNPERYDRLRDLDNHHGAELDGAIGRQIHLLALAYGEKHVAADLLQKMAAKSNAIEQAFNVYRPSIGTDSKPLTDNDIRALLAQSTNSAEVRQAWEASKGVGPQVAADLLALVHLRNQAAVAAGYSDYHTMQLAMSEQDPGDVLTLFDELDALTRDAYADVKAGIDAALARKFAISVEDLRPWHYGDPFFQDAPALYGVDADAVYANANLVDVASRFYHSIGLPVDDVLQRSDLYEKPGKSPHAFCTDIDRNGDVRVLLNIRPTEKWQSTLLHELGHAVYSSKNMPRSTPYVLRAEAHILTTEGVAMMFERLLARGAWVKSMGLPLEDETAFTAAQQRKQKAQLLVFSRWCQVMLRFERALYTEPHADLNTLWWDLVEKYQFIHRPDGRNAPDYASKIHIVSAPCYYHNYMMGQLFASQLHHTLAATVQHVPPDAAIYIDDPQVGAFMRDKVFSPGRRLTWNELTRFATGAPLRPDAFAADFQTP